LLGDPGAIRVGRHPGQVDPPGVQFDEEQHIQPPQPDGVDGEEVAGDDFCGLLAQERPPCCARRPRGRVEPAAVEWARIAVAETRMPRRWSSPWMRW
jgi:hypothetical protein